MSGPPVRRPREAVAEVAEAMAQAAAEERGPRVVRPIRAGRLRPVVAVGPDGAPTRIVTHADLLQGLFTREAIEIAVVGKRPEKIQCSVCRVTVAVQPAGRLPTRCKPHQREWERERNREHSRRFHVENPKAAAEATRAKRERDLEAVRAAHREYSRKHTERNLERVREQKRTSRARCDLRRLLTRRAAELFAEATGGAV